LNYLTAIRESN